METEYSRTPLSEKQLSSTPILIMTVDIGEGLKDNIIIYQNSSIESVVSSFSMKHSLTVDQENTLIGQIYEHLNDEVSEPLILSKNEYFKQWDDHINKHLKQPPQHQPKINKNSIKIMQQKQVLPVYDRLYAQSSKNRPEQIELKQQPKGTQCGSRLYMNWKKKKQQAESARSRIQEMKEEEILKELTFKPQINENISVSSSYKQDPILLHKHRGEVLERKRFEMLAKEQEICTFSPQINAVSEYLMQNKLKLRPKNKFEELYEEATIRKEKNEELIEQYYDSQFNFRPEGLSVTLDDHIERLYSSKKETEEHLQNRRKELNQLVDSVTGQEYFKPKIGRPPKSNRQATESIKTEEQPYVLHKPLQLASRNRSEEILTRKKRTRYQEIFNSLNHYGAEEISSSNITIENIEPCLLRIIQPLLQELEDEGCRLNFEEFFDSMENLCRYLTPEERYTLLKERPQVAMRFEAKERKSSSTGRMYTKGVKYKEEVEAKVVAERMKKSNDELKECTFHPRIKQYKRDRPGKNYSWLLN